MIGISTSSWHYRWTNYLWKRIPVPAGPHLPVGAKKPSLDVDGLPEYLFMFTTLSAISLIFLPIYGMIQALKYPKVELK